MKSYTDIVQSKQLAKILPIESADMIRYYSKEDRSYVITDFPDDAMFSEDDIPAWSLSALLDLLPEQSNLSKRYAEDCETMTYWIWISSFDYESEEYTNPIDACYEMVLKLKEENLL